MISTIILLYALNASNPVPTGCFVAAWFLCIPEMIFRFINYISLANERIESKRLNEAIISTIRKSK